MERGIRVTRLAGAPDFSSFKRESYEDSAPRSDAPRMDKPWKNKPKEGGFKDGPRTDGPRTDGPRKDGPRKEWDGPRKEWQGKDSPAKDGKSKFSGEKPREDRRIDDEVWGDKPKARPAASRDANTSERPAGEKPFKKPYKDASSQDRPFKANKPFSKDKPKGTGPKAGGPKGGFGRGK
jgi:ATP-dependent RNA helicase DeaD